MRLLSAGCKEGLSDDARRVDRSDERKSIGAENTLLTDTDERMELLPALKELAADVVETFEKNLGGALTALVGQAAGRWPCATPLPEKNAAPRDVRYNGRA